MKTKKELESLKDEMAQLKKKLVELTDDELAMVTGGQINPRLRPVNHNLTEINKNLSYNNTQIVP